MSAFADFWKVYPRKRDKGHAEKAWPRAVKKADEQTIITAAREFAQWCVRTRQEQQFIAYPATWLNGERWLDELADDENATPPDNMQGHLSLVNSLWENSGTGYPQVEG
jgi:hypothetical protein